VSARKQVEDAREMGVTSSRALISMRRYLRFIVPRQFGEPQRQSKRADSLGNR
jgi:hypothetical protein